MNRPGCNWGCLLFIAAAIAIDAAAVYAIRALALGSWPWPWRRADRGNRIRKQAEGRPSGRPFPCPATRLRPYGPRDKGRRPQVPKKDKPLTAKQEAFAREMAKPRAKQQDAYRAAYDCKRMNYNSISCAASKLMRDPRIAHRIQEIRDAAAKDCRWELQDAAPRCSRCWTARCPSSAASGRGQHQRRRAPGHNREREAAQRHVRRGRREGRHGGGGGDHR